MPVSGNAEASPTERVRRHRASTGLIRVEVEVPVAADALAVRRFAQARRRAAEAVQGHPAAPAAQVRRAAWTALWNGWTRSGRLSWRRSCWRSMRPAMPTCSIGADGSP